MTEILFARLSDTIQSVTNDTNVTGTLVPGALGGTLQLGWTGTLAGTRGGTGVNNGAKTITIGGNVIFSGAYAFTGTLTGTTTVTFPTNDTLVGRATTDTLTNKTLTSPVINVGSDATGDLYYRNSGGAFTRLGIGSSGNVLEVSGGLPSWQSFSAGLTIGTTTVSGGSAGNLLYTDGTDLQATGSVTFPGTGAIQLSTLQFSTDTKLSRLAAGQMMLSDSTTATKLTISESTDSLTSRTNYADFTIDTGTVANTVVLGTNRGGTSTWGGNWELAALGTNVFDYGVSTASILTAGVALQVPAGSLSVPGLQIGSANFGLFETSGATLNFSSGGVTKLSIISGASGYLNSAVPIFMGGTGTPGLAINSSGSNIGNVVNVDGHTWGLGYSSGIITNGTTVIKWTDNGAVTVAPVSGNLVVVGGTIQTPGTTTPVFQTTAAITSGAASGSGTLTNAPASGNPTKWIPINDNGTTRYIPAW